MIHKAVARALSQAQRELLIDHVDGSSALEIAVIAGERSGARKVLIAKRLIRPDRRERPRSTVITDDGRQVLSWVLAEYADALARAGCVGIATPIAARSAATLVLNVDLELAESA